MVGDASVVNSKRETPRTNRASVGTGISIRMPSRSLQSESTLKVPTNDEIDKLVSSGQLTVPLLNIWNHADTNTCGSTPMQCPLRDGSVVTMGATDCVHQPLAAAITAEGPGSTSENLPLCVQLPGTPNCSLHVVTTHAGLTNSDPSSASNYLSTIMNWVDNRLAGP